MFRLSIPASLLLTSFLVAAAPAVAQNWSAAEREVLQALDACLQTEVDRDMQAQLDCAHDDFLGWRNDLPALRDKAFMTGNIQRTYETGDPLIGFSIQPLSVRVYGDIAIIHYYGYYYFRNDNGEDYDLRSRWTDVMLNDNGKWVWIADHGGDDPGSKPAGIN